MVCYSISFAAIQALVNASVKRPPVAMPQSKSVGHQPPITPPERGRQANFNVRVVNPSRKSQYETYVLHNVGHVSTPDCLREEILKQFGKTIVSQKLNFSIGYIKSGSKVWIRSKSDVDDVWAYVRKGDNITLWCNGIGSSTPAPRDQSSTETESDEDSRPRKPKKKKRKTSALEEKNDRVEEIFAKLRKKHDTKYTTLQYRLWAEMVDVGTHK